MFIETPPKNFIEIKQQRDLLFRRIPASFACGAQINKQRNAEYQPSNMETEIQENQGLLASQSLATSKAKKYPPAKKIKAPKK